jgi:hypothetical protein
MTDEVVVPQEGEGDAPQGGEPQYTALEQEALSHGWKPESEFDASSGKEFRSAKEFMQLKPLYDKIDEQHKEVKNLKRGLEAFGKHYNKVEQAAYERAMNELKSARTQALEEGDLVRAEAIRDEMDEKRAEATRKPVVEEVQVDRSAEMNSWKQKNDWYEKDEDMTAYADGVGNKLLAQGKEPTEILAEVARRTRAAFPHKFRNPNKDSAPIVGGGSSKGKSGGSDTAFMSPTEVRIMESLIKSGAPITREVYINDLKKSKGLK